MSETKPPLKRDPMMRYCYACIDEIKERIPLDSEGICSGCGFQQGKAVLVPNHPSSENAGWCDWPEESFDDPACRCDYLENFTLCPIHGKKESLARYQQAKPHYFHYEVEPYE